MTHQTSAKRARLRRTVTVLATALVAVLAAPVAALADTPADWPDSPHPSGLDFLIVLFLIPLGIALVISVLTVLPSLIREKGYEPGQSWRGEAEWFGGPTKGVESVESVSPAALEGEHGGTSAKW